MTDNLKARLRLHPSDTGGPSYPRAISERTEAADRIEALEAEVTRLRGALAFYAGDCDATPATGCGYKGNLCCMTARAALAHDQPAHDKRDGDQGADQE